MTVTVPMSATRALDATGDALAELRARLHKIAVEEADMDPVAEFFDAPPLDPGAARRVVAMRERRAREAAYDETRGMSEDEERARSGFAR